MREALHLVKHGVPFDVAFSLDEKMRSGWAIILTELDTGKVYNFAKRAFELRS